jgi:ABC-type Fe3+/spermidine/putrescine transport system ATPase subunit
LSKPPVLELNCIEFSYSVGQNSSVLGPLSLDLNDDTILGVVGANGAGKSTLLHIIGGHLEPAKGVIKLNGIDITKISARKRKISTVFQTHALFPTMTVLQNVELPLKHQNSNTKSRRDEALVFLSMVGMEHKKDSYPVNLSGGESQRVALARALACKPELLLFDEPVSSVDREKKIEFMQLILELKSLGKLKSPIIIVSHDPEVILALSDKVAILHGGKLVEFTVTSELVESPKYADSAHILMLGNHFAENIVEGLNSNGTCSIFVKASNITFSESRGKLPLIEGELLKVSSHGAGYYSFIKVASGTVHLLNSIESPPNERNTAKVFTTENQYKRLNRYNNEEIPYG